ncbi:MAG: glutamate 5-kinase [Paracoccaceae bacterium]
MDTLNSATLFASARRVVIKVGSALLVDAASGHLRTDWVAGLAGDIAMLRAKGAEVVLVSSGSIALGRRVLGLPAGPLALEHAQAAAAVGQIRLARAYQEILAPLGIEAAQVLVTLEDSQNRRRYLNSRATMNTLLELGCVPIVNENDTVATDEIRYGDNDRLAAQVASLVGADILVLLSDIDGLFTADPRRDASARLLPHVAEITPEIEAMAGGAASEHSRGGMATKVMAAKVALQSGAAMVITRGDRVGPVAALIAGTACTWFKGQGDPASARKKWISGMKPKGVLRVDAGAGAALASGKSLLPAGVRAVEGAFERGDPVDIRDAAGALVARGLAGYAADEARKIAGKRSGEIAGILGYPARPALVHRDDMAI